MRATSLSILTSEHSLPVAAPADSRLEIEFRGVAKHFPGRGKSAATLAVQGLDLAIRRGEVVSIIGPSGCGKSTLLNMGAVSTHPAKARCGSAASGSAVRYARSPSCCRRTC